MVEITEIYDEIEELDSVIEKDTASNPVTKRKPSKQKLKQKSAKKEEQDRIELELLKETVSQNPYQFAERSRRPVHKKIADHLNKKFPTPDPREARYVRDTLKRLLDKWKSSDRAERRVTGGGEVEEPTEKERLLTILAEEEDKGSDMAQAETEKKTEDIRKVESIQAKAMLSLRAKRASVESDSEEDEETIAWKIQCKQINDEAMGKSDNLEKSDSKFSSPGTTEDTKLSLKEKQVVILNSAGKQNKRTRGMVAERLCEKKFSVEAKWRHADLEARSKDLALQLADKKEERELRLQQLDLDKKKAEMDHELKLEKKRLKKEMEDKRLEMEKAEKDRTHELWKTLLVNLSGSSIQSSPPT